MPANFLTEIFLLWNSVIFLGFLLGLWLLCGEGRIIKWAFPCLFFGEFVLWGFFYRNMNVAMIRISPELFFSFLFSCEWFLAVRFFFFLKNQEAVFFRADFCVHSCKFLKWFLYSRRWKTWTIMKSSRFLFNWLQTRFFVYIKILKVVSWFLLMQEFSCNTSWHPPRACFSCSVLLFWIKDTGIIKMENNAIG